MSEYIIIELVNETMDSDGCTLPPLSLKFVNAKISHQFMGPSIVNQTNNLGLYVAEDLDLAVFYYKDIFKNL